MQRHYRYYFGVFNYYRSFSEYCIYFFKTANEARKGEKDGSTRRVQSREASGREVIKALGLSRIVSYLGGWLVLAV